MANFQIVLADGSKTHISAEKFVINNGYLIFSKRDSQYPYHSRDLAAYAPGQFLSVKGVD